MLIEVEVKRSNCDELIFKGNLTLALEAWNALHPSILGSLLYILPLVVFRKVYERDIECAKELT